MPAEVAQSFRISISRQVSKILSKLSFKGIGRIRNALAKVLMPDPVGGPVIVPTVYKFSVMVNPDDDRSVDHSLYYHGYYELGTNHVILKILKSEDVFLDIGANIGLMSMVAANKIGSKGKVYSFEPVPHTFEILEKNVELNKFKNIIPLKKGIGEKNESGVIYENTESDRGTSSMISVDRDREKPHEIEIISLDNFVKSGNIKADMIKIDVEGWELMVLKGAKELLSDPNAPALCVEYSNMRETFDGKLLDIYEYIKSINDYRIFKLRNKELITKLSEINSVEDLPEHDNIFSLLQSHLDKLDSSFFK